MTPVITIEKKTFSQNQKTSVPAIFINDHYFAYSIETSRHGYEIPDPDDCFCCAQPFSLKNAGIGVILMPTFGYMIEEFNYTAHITSYMHLNYPVQLNNTIYFFSQEQYAKLCSLLPNCPTQDQLPQLTQQDVANIVWWDSPCKDERFGISESINLDFSLTPKITRELYVATNAPEGKEILTILENMLKEYAASDNPVKLVPSEEVVSIVLDTPDYFEWKPLSVTPEGYSLALEPGLQVQKI